MSVTFSSPLPPPGLLKQYEEVQPGMVDKIIAMAEVQSAHRRSLETTVVESNAFAQKVSPFLGSAVLLACLYFGYKLVSMGQNAYGVALMFGAIASVVGITVWGKISYRNDLKGGADAFNKAAQEAMNPERQLVE
ncbi:MAG: uncharacterized protein JWO13_3130 [Acidobacteriales bacterium]|nr:uncharacterized protein [Terriglobales bacterium]